VVGVSDFILIHGNGVNNPTRIAEMIRQTRAVKGYKPMPILFNEDDHFDFDKPENNFVEAVKEYASWGFFDYRMKGESFDDGYLLDHNPNQERSLIMNGVERYLRQQRVSL
jgi:hypothetical protein